ncbi:MAG: hypothetical protein NVS4B7_03480 [Ktedonobacteraceae bacterium]
MAQVLPHFCPRCGTPSIAGQSFCARCGFVFSASSTVAHSPSAQQQPRSAVWQNSGPAAVFPQRTQKRKMGKGGFVVILLLLLILIGTGGYIAIGLAGIHLPGFDNGVVAGNTQPSVTTTQINTAVTYAGVDLTVLTAQQAESFADDPHTATTGMVRLHMQEQNKTSTRVSWSYYDIARLLLPGKNTVAPTFVQAKVAIASGVTQQSSIDFAVPTGTPINQLLLRLGASNEAQMDIPLTGQADLSKYAPKTVKLSATMSYVGLDWTLASATSQLSIAGQQASKNMAYLVVALKVDNTLSQRAIPGSAYDYARLVAGSTTFLPKNTTLPVAFDAGETDQTGTVTFLIPQESTAFTLILLAQGGADQASTDFQLT